MNVNILEIGSHAGFSAGALEKLRQWPQIESIHGEPDADGRYRNVTVVARSAEDAVWLKQSIEDFDAREAAN